MKISVIKMLPFFLLLVSLSGCSDDDGCSEKKREDIPLLQENINLISYSGLDTLRFITEKNETIVFIGQGKKNYSFMEIASSGGCKIERNFSGQSIKFLTSEGDKMDITYDSKSDIQIEIYNNYQGKFHEYFSTIKRPPYDFSNLIINGNTYDDVTVFYTDIYDSDSLYYSLKGGVVRVRLSSGETFNLIN